MTTNDAVNEPRDQAGRLSPADVHGVLFSRAGLGRRGYDETEVDVFLDRVQVELSRLIAEKGSLRDDVSRLRNQLAEEGTGPQRDEASIQAVRILSAAQQTADQYVADAEHYSRRVSSEARQHYEEIIEAARARAKTVLDDAERVALESSRGIASVDGAEIPGQAQSRQELEEQVAYLRTFSQVCRAQLRSYLEALLRDIEDEWGRADPEAAMSRGLPAGRGGRKAVVVSQDVDLRHGAAPSSSDPDPNGQVEAHDSAEQEQGAYVPR